MMTDSRLGAQGRLFRVTCSPLLNLGREKRAGMPREPQLRPLVAATS